MTGLQKNPPSEILTLVSPTSSPGHNSFTLGPQRLNGKRFTVYRYHLNLHRSCMQRIFRFGGGPLAKPWSSLDKEESLACQIASPFYKKIGCFCTPIFLILFNKKPGLLLNGHASDSSLIKDGRAV